MKSNEEESVSFEASCTGDVQTCEIVIPTQPTCSETTETIESTEKASKSFRVSFMKGTRSCEVFVLDQSSYDPTNENVFDRLVYALRLKVILGKKVIRAERYKTDKEFVMQVVKHTQMYEHNIKNGNCILLLFSKGINPADALVTLTYEDGVFKVEEIYAPEESFRISVHKELLPKAILELASEYEYKSLEISSLGYYVNSLAYIKPSNK